MVRRLPSEPEAIASETTGAWKPASGGLSSAIAWVWSVVASRRTLHVLGALLVLWCIGALAIPGSLPGRLAGAMSVAGQTTYLSDLLHPVAAWILRVLLAAMAFVLVVRMARRLLPSMDGLATNTEPMSLGVIQSVEGGSSQAAAWDHVFAELDLQSPACEAAEMLKGRPQVLVYPTLGRRLCSQIRIVGIILMIAATLAIWAGASNVVTPALLSGVEYALPREGGASAQRVTPHALETSSLNGEASATVWWSEPGESSSYAVSLSETRWRLHRGLWIRIAYVVPAVSLQAYRDDGSLLTLQPVVGDRQGITEYRAVLDTREERVLTIPEAGKVLRIVAVTDGADGDQVLVEVLDGGLGTVVDLLRLPGDTALRVDGMAVEARMEQACVLTLWKLPGLALLVLGAIMALAGLILGHVCPPWRAWIGLAQMGKSGEWQLLLATDPPSLAATLTRRLGPETE
ncbi:MAG: hypothetical protein R6X16_11985 [Anaerolineae bacterium]